MIPWWTIVLPTIALAGWSYLLGRTKERERCVKIACDEVGRCMTADGAFIATHIADRLATPNGRVDP